MRAAVLREYGEPLEITDVERPTVAAHGALVDVEACGICRSDWHAWRGDYDRQMRGGPLGHEPVGTVIEVGADVEAVREGDRVTVPFNLADGTCPRCRRGNTHKCENNPGGTLGAFAEQLYVPWADVNAIRLPDSISTIEMVGLGCRFMTSFHALAHRASIDAGDRIAVYGCGGVGLSAIDIGDALGADVIAVDLSEEKLSMARDVGAVETINAAEIDDVPAAIRDLTDGGAEVSVDALGIAETCRNSIGSLDYFGQHIQIGLTTREEDGEIPLPTDEMVRKEIEFIGSHGMPPTRYDEIFRMVERGRVDPSAIVTRRVALEDINERLTAMSDYETRGIEIITEL